MNSTEVVYVIISAFAVCYLIELFYEQWIQTMTSQSSDA